MPWERRTVEDQRREFAQAALQCSNFSAMCREFGIDRHTGYKWKQRYEAQLPLTDQSRRPHTSPGRTPEEMELRILAVRADNPGWGARKIREFLNHTAIADIADAEKKFSDWRDKYNNLRPHEALGMKRPGDVYVPSSREYNEKIQKFEYGGAHHVIKVNSWGYVRFDKWQIYLSETMIGQYIEFRPSPDGETFVACYRNFKIAEFDTQDGRLIHRSIARL